MNTDLNQDMDNTKMPLLDHLIELRTRLMWSLASILLLFIVIFPFSENVYQVLVQPLADIFEELGGQRRLIFTALHEAFFTYIKLSLITALFIAFPFISMQFWMFVAPGLYKNEKKALIRKIVSYFDKENFNVIYREYKFVYRNWFINLDMNIIVNMD